MFLKTILQLQHLFVSCVLTLVPFNKMILISFIPDMNVCFGRYVCIKSERFRLIKLIYFSIKSFYVLTAQSNVVFRTSVGSFVLSGGLVVSHVNITNVSQQDGGLLTCTASNIISSTSVNTRLNVYGEIVSLIYSGGW